MADEPDDIERDLLRERLLRLAEHGELTGKQAEATAAAHGLEPFARKPELPRFDPKLKSHWSIMMVVAWIAWRDFELVRKQDPEFCSACFHWVVRKRKVRLQNAGEPVRRMVYSLAPRRAPTVGRLALLDELFLLPHARGQGIGKVAVAAAVRFSREAGCGAMALEVDQGNIRAQRLYESIGFVSQGRDLLTLSLD